MTKEDMKEVWQKISDFYEVSSMGKVRSWVRWKRNGIVYERDAPLLLKESVKKNGYKYVTISGKHKYVHRLVSLAFIGPSEKNINHKNGNKTDNRLCNLEYCTTAQNTQHAHDNNLIRKPRGEERAFSKLNPEKVKEIRKSKLTLKRIAEKYGISVSTAYKVKNRITWGHV